MLDVSAIRTQFPALLREVAGNPAIFFDGPAGSQVPTVVIDAIADALRDRNANCGGPFATSQESDGALEDARVACCDLLQVGDSSEIVFGANMTTITLSLSRVLGRTWKPGDEIIVSGLDHDANVTPWMQAAARAGATVHQIRVNAADCTLDQHHYRQLLNQRTRLVAVGYAANSTGTINPVREMVSAARQVGALTFIDAVHLAPHRRIHAEELGCDFLVCSAYKFFGPHVGVLWGRRELLEELQPDKLRPAPNTLPGKWMTGTQNHEGISGLRAAIDYLAGLSGLPKTTCRRARLDQAFELITAAEQQLASQMISRLQEIPGLRIWGVTNPQQQAQRVPTLSVTHPRATPRTLAAQLGQAGIFCWGGNHYAFPWTTAVGLEPEGSLRVGMLHYNTAEEVDRCADVLSGLLDERGPSR